MLKEIEPTAARAIAVSIRETTPPICIHYFLIFISFRFSDATQSLRCDGAEEDVRGLQAPAVKKKGAVSAEGHGCWRSLHSSLAIFCFILFPHPLAPSLSSYVAAFILCTESNPETDPNADFALWVGYETQPTNVFWPPQHCQKQSSNKYLPDGLDKFYVESMLTLHKQTFIILRNLIHDWEQDDRRLVQCSALFDLYSKERLSHYFCPPLWSWLRKTLAPIDKTLGAAVGPGATAAAKKCMKTWKSQLALVVQHGGHVLGFEACPSGAERSNVAVRVEAAGLQGSSRKLKRKVEDGKQKSDTSDGYCSSSSSATISRSSSSSGVDEDDDDSAAEFKRRQRKRQPPRRSTSPERIFEPNSRLIDGRTGRLFADARCVSVTMLPRCAVLCAPVCTLACVCEAHDLGFLQRTRQSGRPHEEGEGLSAGARAKECAGCDDCVTCSA